MESDLVSNSLYRDSRLADLRNKTIGIDAHYFVTEFVRAEDENRGLIGGFSSYLQKCLAERVGVLT
jgi:hypothetical protein